MSEEFSVTASLKGAIGETLVTEHKSAIEDFFIEWCVSDLEEKNPEWVPDVEYRVSFDIDPYSHSYDVSIDSDFATWRPDAVYELTFDSSYRVPTSFERYTVEFPVEVKTGQSSELSDNQRAVMATIEQQSNPIFPIRIRVDITELPDRFSIIPYRVQHDKETPLPKYSTEDTPKPAETVERTGSDTSVEKTNSEFEEVETVSSSLSEFQNNSSPDLEEHTSEEFAEAVREASDNLATSFTAEEVLAALDQGIPEPEVQAELLILAKHGQIYEVSEEEWKPI